MIKILHLYYDLLNQYGEQGNILALKDSFRNQNVEVSIDLLSCGDKIDFKKYDLIYMGTGSDENLYIALEDIKKYKKEIKSFIKKNKYFIATGNSYLMFGKYIECNGKTIEGLDIFDYYAKSSLKITGECFMAYKNFENPIIGFQNRKYVVQNNFNHLFAVISGNADNFKSEFEGYHEFNFFGTFVIGPLLIRNPEFNDMIVKDILEKNNLKYHDDTDTNLYKAYFEYLKNFYEKS